MDTIRRSSRVLRPASVLTAAARCPMHHVRSIARASAAALFAAAGGAQALPQGQSVVSGTATVTQSPTSMRITASDKAIINWTGFDIGTGQSVRFDQPGQTSVVLNRVSGGTQTSIQGSLNANGQVFIVNPAGVLFGSGAQVNVGGLVASTLDISDSNFQSGTYTFSGSSSGEVKNASGSTLKTPDYGYVALIGPAVKNAGTIETPRGSAVLAAGGQVTLTMQNGGPLGYTIDTGLASALAQNESTGHITANGGRVILTAKGVAAAAQATVNQDGVLEAQTIDVGGAPFAGSIQLLGDTNTQVHVTGRMDVSAPAGLAAGRIETVGTRITVAPTANVIDGLGTGAKGSWRIAQTDPGTALNIGTGSDVSNAALSNALANANVTVESAGDVGNLAGPSNAVSWNSDTTLTLKAASNVNLDGLLQNTAGGNVVLRADSGGTGSGTIRGAGGGAPTGFVVVNTGRADLYYNPSSYTTPTDFSAVVPVGAYDAWMLVNTQQNLRDVSTNLSGNYALGRSLSFAGAPYFSPLGDATTPFSGKFDGLNQTLSGIAVNGLTKQGVFGVIGATGLVRNLGIVDSAITGYADLGVLAGVNDGTIENSYSLRGTVSQPYGASDISGRASGGLVGTNNGTINRSWSSAGVSNSTGYSGGLVGVNAGTINQSYSAGSADGYDRATGGLVGINSGTITDSYSSASASATFSQAGGLVGQNGGTIQTSYSTGGVFSTVTNGAGALAGSNSGSIANSYSSSLFSFNNSALPLVGSGGGSVSGGSRVLSAAESRQQSSFTGFDFTTIWRIYNGNTTPLLKAFLKPLTVVARAPGKVYDGSAWSPNLVFYFSDTAAASDPAFQLNPVVTAGPAKDAGTYAIGYTLSPVTVQQGGYDLAGYYNDVPLTTSLTIDKRAVTVQGATAQNRDYNGTTTATVSGGSLSGVVGGETLNFSINAQFVDKNAGTGKQVLLNTVLSDGSGGVASNYVYDEPLDLAATIAPKALSVNAQSATKTYDGTTAASGGPSVSGLVTGDVVAAASQSFDAKNAGARRVNASVARIDDANGADMTGNYAITYTDAAGQIDKAALHVAAQSETKTYDGTTTATGAPVATGIVAGDVVAAASQSFDAKNAGARRLNASLTRVNDANGADMTSNYAITYTDAGGLINQAVLNVTAQSASKTYDGATAAAGAPVVAGVVSGDVLVSATQRFDSKNAGARRVNASIGRINDANGNDMTGNYAVHATDAGGFIDKAALGISAQSDSKAFDGGVASAKAPQVTGLKTGDRITASQTYDGAALGDHILTPVYTIDDGNGGGNYQVATSTARGSIYFSATDVTTVDGAIKNPGSVGGLGGAGGGGGDTGDFRLPAAILNHVGDAYGASIYRGKYPGTDAGPEDRVAMSESGDGDGGSSGRRKKTPDVAGSESGFRFDVQGAGIRLPDGVE